MATSMSNLFGINKFDEFQVDVLNKLLELLLTSKETMGKKVLVLGLGLEPTTLRTPVRCSTNWASRASCYHRPTPVFY